MRGSWVTTTTARSGAIATSGANSYGLYARSVTGAITLNETAGSITTSGAASEGGITPCSTATCGW